MAADDEPDVVDGVFTAAFYRRVAVLDAQARKVGDSKPKCSKCFQPMWCDQPGAHFVCAGLIK